MGDGQSTNKRMVVEPTVDFRLQFTTDRKFTTRQEKQQWIFGEAKKLGFIAMVAKSNNGRNNRKAFVVIDYQRCGSHKAYVKKKWEAMATLKCNCSFRLRSYLLSCSEWSVSIIDETHNHKMTKRFEDHKYVERLKSKEVVLVLEMSNNNALPRNILSMIRSKSSTSSTTIKCLANEKYIYITRSIFSTQPVSDVFWTHLNSIKLCNVVVMHSTQKTNK
jgi:hypothetical protein